MNQMAKSRAIIFCGILFAFFLWMSFPCSSFAASGKIRVAVLDFEQKGTQEIQGKQVGEIVAEWMTTALVRTGRFDVIERAQLQKILKEQQLGMSGMINQETAVKVGELLGVKVIVTGSIIQIGNTYEVNARLINVEDGAILKAEKIRGPGLESIEQMMGSLVELIKKDFPIEGFVVMVNGNRVMIDLGRIHGVEPGMRFFAFRKGAPVRHPVTGKMLKGEDVRIGEMIIQNLETETCWGEISREEAGVKITAGNIARYAGEETFAMAPTPTPAKPAARTGIIWTSKMRSEKILTDWNGDGLYDLLLGDSDGYVTVYLNQGTNDTPRYAAGMKLKAGGKEIKVRSPSAPCLVDWNGDGKRDLLVGNGGGYMHLFLNDGSNQEPNFVAGVMVQAAGKDLDVGGKASPCVIDWNEDGKKDLVMGNGSGEIFLYVNEGTNEQPIFGKPIKLNGGSLDVGSNSSPDMIDWNGDGKKDLIIGNSSGEIHIFLNQGTNEDPQYENTGDKLSLKFGDEAAPRILNWNRTSQNDLLVADRNGEVTLCINKGGAKTPVFAEKKVIKPGKR
jgi:TolB-like protein